MKRYVFFLFLFFLFLYQICQIYKRKHNLRESCTLVTAYYEVPSKHSHSKYHKWGKTLLTLKCPIVIFIEPRHAKMVKEWRGDKPIYIIEIPFEELEMWVNFSDIWKKQHQMDPEKMIHSPELYAIWAMKTTFVEKAIYINPFRTKYFFWCDFGAFREETYPSYVLNCFPNTRYFYKDKIIIQSINPLSRQEWYLRNDGIRGEPVNEYWNHDRLAGGLWGGGIEGCLRWNKAFKETLKMFFEKNRVASKEQIVMLSAYLRDPSIAVVIKPTYGNPWFFFQYLLSDTDKEYVEYIEDPSYIL